MNILLTGGAGFIGHHVAEYILKTTNWRITFLDRLDCSGNLNRITSIDGWEQHKRRCKWVHHDLRAPISDALMRQLGDQHCVLHLAALTHVDRSIVSPLDAVMDNVVGTAHILDYARRISAEKFLYFGTDEVFGPAPAGVAYKEWDRYRSTNPYSATKAGGEELALAYHNTYDLPVIITHTMNVIGERQHPEKYVPSTISKVMLGEEVLVHADVTCTKPGSRFYIHAQSVASAVVFLLKNGKAGDKYNIVGEREVDNLQLAKVLAEIIGKPLKYKLISWHASRPGHDLRYALCGEKLKSMGWTSPICFETALERTVEWAMKHPEWLGVDRPSVRADPALCNGDGRIPSFASA